MELGNNNFKDKFLIIGIIALSILFVCVLSYVYLGSMARGLHVSLIILLSSILFIFLGLAVFTNHVNVHRLRDLMRSQKAIISALAGLAEWRDPETGQHLERTRHYCFLLGKKLSEKEKYSKRLHREFVEGLFDAAPLHDIGKVGIPDSILHKRGKLTAEEYDKMKEHVNIGKGVLNNIVVQFKIDKLFFSIGENICAYHHEKFNGTGYPYRLKGDDIPIEARIFSLCDVYDALRSKRPYKEVVPHQESLEIIRAESGKHFDPDIVEAFLECEQDFKEISNMGI